MTHDRFEDFLRAAARDYRTPPPTPREAMWARIERARVQPAPPARRPGWSSPWARWGMGIAAVLALGIAIGRVSVRGGEEATVTITGTAADPADESAILRLVAADYLERTDAFLTVFRTEARVGRADGQLGEMASDLLTTARLMMDSPVGDDPILLGLLQDLEGILVQITNYMARARREELDFIERGLDDSDVLLRLRATVEAAEPATL